MNPSVIDHNGLRCLQYLGPWIKNIGLFMDPTSGLHERSVSRMRDCIRVLSDLTTSFPMVSTSFQRIDFADSQVQLLQLQPCIQQYIWTEVTNLDASAVDIILEELVRSATDAGVNNPRCETMAQTIASFASISVRGRLISRLRKARKLGY
jgi:hypothetical protein